MLTKEKKTTEKINATKSKTIAVLLAPLIFSAFILSGCDKKEDNAAAQTQKGPPPQVGFVTVTPKEIGLTMELPGRLEAFRVADVRARVAGVLQKVMFEEGSYVEEGQQLFQIDDAMYKASLQSSKAHLAQAQAGLLRTKAMADRSRPLVKVNAISKQDYDNAVAAQKASEADILAAQAAIHTSQINLGYASVKSPISGRIGRALVTEGALVGQGAPTELAVVQQIDKLYVNITQSATDYIKLQEALKKPGQFKRAGDGSLPMTIVLDTGSVYSKQASMMFTDWTVNETTGQVTMRAVLDNEDQMLLPGLYVRVRLEQVQAENAYLVPQKAITRTGQTDILYVVVEKGPMNFLEQRPVVISGRNGSNWVVTSGLNPGDKVVVDGLLAWQMAMGQAMQEYAKKMQDYKVAKEKGEAVDAPPEKPNVSVIPIDTMSAAVPNAPAAGQSGAAPQATGAVANEAQAQQTPAQSTETPEQSNNPQK